MINRSLSYTHTHTQKKNSATWAISISRNYKKKCQYTWEPQCISLYEHVLPKWHSVWLRFLKLTDQFECFSPELPLIPLIRLVDAGFIEVRVCLSAAVTLSHRLLYHFTLVFTLEREYIEQILLHRWTGYIMMTSSNGNIFRITGLCARNSPVSSEFPSQRPVTLSFDVFFDLVLNKRLSKQSRRQWFETPSHLLCRHCNDDIFQ